MQPINYVEVAHQLDCADSVLPSVVVNDGSLTTQQECADWIKSKLPELEAKLAESGAILFRGFPVDSAETFDEFCSGDVPSGWVNNSSDTDDDCYSNYHDCVGVCDGDAAIQTYWNDNDGDGLGGETFDEFCSADVPSGWVNNSSDIDDDCYSNYLDCSGVCDGDAILDNCDVCDNDPANDCPFDCEGVAGGSAIIDDCGICSYGTTGHMPNSDMDDCDVCFGNNEADEGCGCFTGPPIDYWYDLDNDGLGSCTVADGNCLPCEEDSFCESFCVWGIPSDNWADNTDDEDDSCYSNYHDCAGVCNGFSQVNTYYDDSDGDSLGAGIGQEFCSAEVPSGWVLNSDDDDDSCYSNYHDCMGICDGSDIVIIYFFDNDGDGLGSETFDEFCSGDVPSGWVNNSSDADDDCYSNYHDCAGVCDGDAVVQAYWNDNDGDGLGAGTFDNFCSGDVPSGWVLNSDDEDDNCLSNYYDCSGVCDGDAAMQTYWNDGDGDGLGDGPGQEFCSADIPSGWVNNSSDIDDECVSNLVDGCGVCDGPGVEADGCCSNVPADCSGSCGGSVALDECSNCGGDCAVDTDGFVTCSTTEDNANNLTVADICGTCGGNGPVEGYDCDGVMLGFKDNLIPDKFALNQNYPNPFNPTTTIEIAVSEFSMVNVNIYDIQGRLIDTIISDAMQPGYHRLQWNAKGVASGMYILEMRVIHLGSQQLLYKDLRKMLLMR